MNIFIIGLAIVVVIIFSVWMNTRAEKEAPRKTFRYTLRYKIYWSPGVEKEYIDTYVATVKEDKWDWSGYYTNVYQSCTSIYRSVSRECIQEANAPIEILERKKEEINEQ